MRGLLFALSYAEGKQNTLEAAHLEFLIIRPRKRVAGVNAQGHRPQCNGRLA